MPREAIKAEGPRTAKRRRLERKKQTMIAHIKLETGECVRDGRIKTPSTLKRMARCHTKYTTILEGKQKLTRSLGESCTE